MIRGVIENIARKQQINDFSGVRIGNITPTDLDGAIDYHGKAFIFIEVKLIGKELPFGQKLFLERIIDAISDNGKYAVAFVIEHDVQDVTQSIPCADCYVREVYLTKNKKWKKPCKKRTLKNMLNGFIDYVDGKNKTELKIAV